MHRREEASYRFYEMGKKASNPIEKTKQAPRNAFTCLNCDSDDEDKNTINKPLTEEFPELVKANITALNKNSNYAAALATAVPEPKVVKSVPIPIPLSLSLSKTEVQVLASTKKVEVSNNIKKPRMLSWADEESDSSDEEEEEEYNNSPINSKNTMVNGYDSDW
jgi:hypothetical protein